MFRTPALNFRAPRHLPTFRQAQDDLCNPSARDLARALGVSERSVYGWQAADHAPRPVLLALFWETSWGRATAECDAWNAVQTYKSLSESLRLEVENLRARVARLERIGNFGTANAPDYQTLPQAIEKPMSVPLTAK